MAALQLSFGTKGIKKILKRKIGKTCICPRYICGKYQRHKLDNILDLVKQNDLAELNLIQAEATNIAPKGKGFSVNCQTPGKSTLTILAAKVVLATGSAPVRDIELPADNNDITLINDLYSPGAIINIKKLANALAATQNKADRSILVVGSNASSIEFFIPVSRLARCYQPDK